MTRRGRVKRDAVLIRPGLDVGEMQGGLQRRLSPETAPGARKTQRGGLFRSFRNQAIVRGAARLRNAGRQAGGMIVRRVVTKAGIALVVIVGGVVAVRIISGQSLESIGHKVGGNLATPELRAQQFARNQVGASGLVRRYVARGLLSSEEVAAMVARAAKQRIDAERGLEFIRTDPALNPIGSSFEAAAKNAMRNRSPFRGASKDALRRAEQGRARMRDARIMLELSEELRRLHWMHSGESYYDGR